MIHMNRWFSSHFFLQSLFMSGGINVSAINCKWIIPCRGCFKCDLWNWKPLIGSGAERNLNGSKITFLLGIVSFWNIALIHLQHWKQEPKIQAQFIVIRLILLHCPTILFYHHGNRFERFLSPYKWTSNLESLNNSCCQKTVSAGTKASPDQMLSYHQWGLVTFTWGQFHWKCSKILDMRLKMVSSILQLNLPGVNELLCWTQLFPMMVGAFYVLTWYLRRYQHIYIGTDQSGTYVDAYRQ